MIDTPRKPPVKDRCTFVKKNQLKEGDRVYWLTMTLGETELFGPYTIQNVRKQSRGAWRTDIKDVRTGYVTQNIGSTQLIPESWVAGG